MMVHLSIALVMFAGFTAFRSLTMTDSQAWSVDLLGEGSIDVGGAYRDVLTLACHDLMAGPPVCPLFLAAPNRTNGIGLNRCVHGLVLTVLFLLTANLNHKRILIAVLVFEL